MRVTRTGLALMIAFGAIAAVQPQPASAPPMDNSWPFTGGNDHVVANRRVSSRERPPARIGLLLDERAARGRLVFMTNCDQCHPGGDAGLGPALNDKPLPEFLKRFQVRHGLGAMPSFSEENISDEQLDDLMEYLRALRRSRPAEAV